MSIYAIADLHLSFKENKPMDIFGDNWVGHEHKIKRDWENKVSDNDLVLLLGDFSWSMNLEDTEKDFEYLSNLPGKKLLLKGNHDYWWTTVTKMKKFLEQKNFKNIDFIYNNAFEFEDYIIAGTRGWNITDEEDNKKIINRECGRLENSLNNGVKKFGKNKKIIACMHYPPITNAKIIHNEETEFIKIMKKYNVEKCLYGHLHSISIKDAVEGKLENIELKLVSADGLNFELYKI